MNNPRVGVYSSLRGNGFPLYEDRVYNRGRISKLARWDDVIIDLGCMAEYPETSTLLQQDSPNIRLHGYVVLSAWNNPAGPEFFKKIWTTVTDTNGFLITTTGKWWSFSNINVANTATMDALADLILKYAAGWDGIFIDLLIPQLWSAKQAGVEVLDWHAMGFLSEEAFLSAWKTNAQLFVRKLKTSGNQVTTNYGIGFPGTTDGNMSEEFERDWNRWISSTREGALHLGYPSAWITSHPFGYKPSNPENKRIFRFGLGSACLFGGFYSFGRYESDTQWCVDRLNFWYPEYSHPQRGKGWLGEPVSVAGQDGAGLWSRTFDQGLVLVNPTPQAHSVYLDTLYRPIGGPAKKAWSVPPHDALILEAIA